MSLLDLNSLETHISIKYLKENRYQYLCTNQREYFLKCFQVGQYIAKITIYVGKNEFSVWEVKPKVNDDGKLDRWSSSMVCCAPTIIELAVIETRLMDYLKTLYQNSLKFST